MKSLNKTDLSPQSVRLDLEQPQETSKIEATKTNTNNSKRKDDVSQGWFSGFFTQKNKKKNAQSGKTPPGPFSMTDTSRPKPKLLQVEPKSVIKKKRKGQQNALSRFFNRQQQPVETEIGESMEDAEISFYDKPIVYKKVKQDSYRNQKEDSTPNLLLKSNEEEKKEETGRFSFFRSFRNKNQTGSISMNNTQKVEIDTNSKNVLNNTQEKKIVDMEADKSAKGFTSFLRNLQKDGPGSKEETPFSGQQVTKEQDSPQTVQERTSSKVFDPFSKFKKAQDKVLNFIKDEDEEEPDRTDPDEDSFEIPKDEQTPYLKRLFGAVKNVFTLDYLVDFVVGDMFDKDNDFEINYQYENDAIDNGLSYSKMISVVEKKLPRKDGKPFSVLQTNTGWHCCFRKYRKTELAELGVGISLYFKMLKMLISFFLLFTILSIPLYSFYTNGHGLCSQYESNSGLTLSSISLGNLGKQQICSFAQVTDQFQISLKCPNGVLYELQIFGMDDENSVCPEFNTHKCLETNDDCNHNSFGNSGQIFNYFDDYCRGQNSCNITLSYDLIANDTSCKQLMMTRMQTLKQQSFFYAQALCLRDSIIVSQTEYKREHVSMVIIALDLTICIVFFIVCELMVYSESFEELEIQAKILTLEDFSVKINNLSKVHCETKSQLEMKALLCNHLEKVLEDEQQVIERLRKFEQHKSEIVNIQLGTSDQEQNKYLLRIAEAKQQIDGFNKDIEAGSVRQYGKEKQKLEKAIEKYIEKLNKLKQQSKSEISDAFIVFRSMEGAARAIKAYEPGFFYRYIYTEGLKRSDVYTPKKFMGKLWLNIKRAIPPELIIWENLGLNKKKRRLRTLLIAFLSLLVLGVFALAAWGIRYQRVISNNITNLKVCNKLTYEEILIEKDQENYKCFCMKNNYFKNNQLDPYYDICASQKRKTNFRKAFTYAMPLIIMTTKIVVQTVLRRISTLEKPKNKNQETFSMLIKNCVIQFINTGIILLVANMQVRSDDDDSQEQQSSFNDFTIEWYQKLGAAVCITLMINIPISKFMIVIQDIGMNKLKIFRDRSKTCNPKRTKQITQAAYEKINMPAEFNFGSRYSTIISNIWITFMYSAGLPLLYFIQFVSLLITYWLDKTLLLKIYRKPLPYTADIAKWAATTLKYSLIAHFCIGVFMFSNFVLMPNEKLVKYSKEELIERQGLLNFDRWSSSHIRAFIVVFAILLFFVLTKTLFEKSLRFIIRMFTDHKETQDGGSEVISNDFYKAVPFETLYYEYRRLRQEKKEYLDAIKHEKISKENLEEVKKYVEKLEKQKKAIETRIRERYFKEYNILYRSFQKGLHVLLQKHLPKEEKKRLKSDIKTFDPKDAQIYFGLKVVEEYQAKKTGQALTKRESENKIKIEIKK